MGFYGIFGALAVFSVCATLLSFSKPDRRRLPNETYVGLAVRQARLDTITQLMHWETTNKCAPECTFGSRIAADPKGSCSRNYPKHTNASDCQDESDCKWINVKLVTCDQCNGSGKAAEAQRKKNIDTLKKRLEELKK